MHKVCKRGMTKDESCHFAVLDFVLDTGTMARAIIVYVGRRSLL